MRRAPTSLVLSATTDGRVTFRGQRPVTWTLAGIEERAAQSTDPEARAEWRRLADDARMAVQSARRARREAAERVSQAQARELYASTVRRYGVATGVLVRAVAAHRREQSETTFESLVRALADARGVSDHEARGLALEVAS